jgi:hypothetical protein
MVDSRPFGDAQDFITYTATRNHQYARQHGYGFKYLHFNLSTAPGNADNVTGCLNHDGVIMALPWCKLLGIYYAMVHYQPKHLVYIDSDACFSPSAGPIDITFPKDVLLLLNNDYPEAPTQANTGVQFWNNRGAATLNALYDWLVVSSSSRTRLIHPYEQRPMQLMMMLGHVPYARLTGRYPPFSNYYHNVSATDPLFEHVLTPNHDATVNSTLIRHYWSPVRLVRYRWLTQLHVLARTDVHTELQGMTKGQAVQTLQAAEVNVLGRMLQATVRRAK